MGILEDETGNKMFTHKKVRREDLDGVQIAL